MKKWIALVLTLTVILTMSACKGNDPETPTQTPTVAPTVAPSEPTTPDATDPTVPDVTDPTVPDVTDPDENEDLVYDMANYQWFTDIFEEKTVEEWNALGQYTLHLGGLHTPVVVNMNGLDVLSVTAFDQTVDLGTDGMANDYHDGYSGVQSIRSTYDAVVIHVSFGEMGDGSILITKNQIFKYPKEFDSSIFLWVKDDGTLGYRQTWIDPKIWIEGWDMLYHPTSRDMVMYQEGTAEIVYGELALTSEKTVLLSDYFDLDAMFAEAKAEGWFEEYETLDELFEDNKTEVVYDMADYQWFTDIFEENPEVNWMSMGRYTLRLEGLHTPVIVNMNGLDVLSVTAFDQTVDLGTDGMANDYHDGYSPVQSIRSTDNAVVVHVSFGEMGDGSIVITEFQSFKYNEAFLFVKDDGTLGFYQGDFSGSIFDQSWHEGLSRTTSRDEVLYRKGSAAFVQGLLVLTVEETVLLSDQYDLDAMFASCKEWGAFAEYETVDELFAANQAAREADELVYNMDDYDFFSHILDEKTVEEWNDMGRYTIRLEGLPTPVLVQMDGVNVRSVSAFDKIVVLGVVGMGYDYFEGYSPVYYINSTEDALVIRISGGESHDNVILITKDKCFDYPNQRDGFIFLWVKDDGTLGYRQTWIDPKIEIEGWHMLYYPTSRGMMMYQEGTAEIVDGELVLTAEKTVLLSDYFDLDALFAEAKAYGMFTEYETVDELFEANKARE